MTTQTAVLVSTVLFATAASAMADVKLPAIFGDNMVLQRDAKVNIWGWAEPGEQVAVTVAGQKAAATAGADGKWSLQLEPLKVSREPVEFTVAGKSNTIALKNVLVGDVWIGSGQSNMTMGVNGCNNWRAEVAAATQPEIRLFDVPRVAAISPQSDVAARWVECSPKTVGPFSAALYFCGRELHRKLNVPIALVHSSWGGTPIEAWTSRAGYESNDQLKPILANWDNALSIYDARLKAAQATQPEAKLPSPAGPNRPTCLYNAMIAPLVPLTVRGVAWYQGESNAGRADLYRVQMPVMIADWRKAFGQQFPFIMVQLANYKARAAQPTDSDWARLREAQSQTAAADPLTGIAVIIDVGDATNIHPTDKQTVGARLALQARKIAYGEKDLVADGPTFKSMKLEGEKVRVTFDNVGGGLEARQRTDVPPFDGPVPLRGFAIAGEDHKFVWAEARIDGGDVIVTSSEVAKPVAVRYGWADNPDCNLYNKEGLPASPFRTDDWAKGK